MPLTLSWPEIAGGGAVAGIGFTVSLLISSLAFDGQQLDEAKLGVLGAAILASLVGWVTASGVIAQAARAGAGAPAHAARPTTCWTSPTTSIPTATTSAARTRAPVTLVEYGDYECPYCGQAEVVIRELLDDVRRRARYVWRHLPLNDVHPNAQMAAEAAEAAAAQGAFWEMHDTLLDHQDALTAPRPPDARGGARPRRRALLGRRSAAARTPSEWSEDVASADASGVAGTPTFFINGSRHHGAYDLATLTAAVRAARARARRAPAAADYP